MDSLQNQLFQPFLRVRNSLHHNCHEALCGYEGELSLITKKPINVRKIKNPRLGIQWTLTANTVPFHTHLNSQRGWLPPCHGDIVCAAIRSALNPEDSSDFILSREAIYYIDASELGKVFRQDAERIARNPEWRIMQTNTKQWDDQKSLQVEINRIIRSWEYTLPNISAGEQIPWYRNRSIAFWGPGAISRFLENRLHRIDQQVEQTNGKQLKRMWEEYVSICRGVGVHVERRENVLMEPI